MKCGGSTGFEEVPESACRRVIGTGLTVFEGEARNPGANIRSKSESGATGTSLIFGGSVSVIKGGIGDGRAGACVGIDLGSAGSRGVIVSTTAGADFAGSGVGVGNGLVGSGVGIGVGSEVGAGNGLAGTNGTIFSDFAGSGVGFGVGSGVGIGNEFTGTGGTIFSGIAGTGFTGSGVGFGGAGFGVGSGVGVSKGFAGTNSGTAGTAFTGADDGAGVTGTMPETPDGGVNRETASRFVDEAVAGRI